MNSRERPSTAQLCTEQQRGSRLQSRGGSGRGHAVRSPRGHAFLTFRLDAPSSKNLKSAPVTLLGEDQRRPPRHWAQCGSQLSWPLYVDARAWPVGVTILSSARPPNQRGTNRPEGNPIHPIEVRPT